MDQERRISLQLSHQYQRFQKYVSRSSDLLHLEVRQVFDRQHPYQGYQMFFEWYQLLLLLVCNQGFHDFLKLWIVDQQDLFAYSLQDLFHFQLVCMVDLLCTCCYQLLYNELFDQLLHKGPKFERLVCLRLRYLGSWCRGFEVFHTQGSRWPMRGLRYLDQFR